MGPMHSFMINEHIEERLVKRFTLDATHARDQRLQTTPIDNFYAEFTQQWDLQKGSKKKKQKKNRGEDYDQKKSGHYPATKQSPKITHPENNDDDHDPGRRDGVVKSKKMMRSNVRYYPGLCLRSARQKRVCLVAQKLKELEMMFDKGNVEYSLDVEEFLHYYSRLTCPVYLDIVDDFIRQIFADFFGPKEINGPRINPHSKLN
ncbi:hypothetical protein Cgig2_018713 [Carnegiea gigantea]|uniref:Uncharacterized protein n=1 Tax=Carnegiea gigantea TaxID=171969 RepID=A0A9Q1KE07_9CARY|nr:hypothetical protein Cgig2_018713 [Carnegiea gigantea]